jgi:EmrB/QacA subfamily drug resistance transporter
MLIPLIVACALFMENLDSSVVATSLPAIARDLAVDPIALKLAFTSYLLAIAVFTPISGWCADRFGARTVFRSAIVVFVLGSVLCGLSSSLEGFVAARIVQGLGGAMMVPVGRLVLVKSVPRSDYVRALSWLTVPALLGPMMGPPVGGFITTYFDWRWIFWINVPISIAGFVLVSIFIENIKEEDTPPLDRLGFLLSGFGLAGFVFGIAASGIGLLPEAVVAVLIGGGGLLLVLYVRHALKAAHPLIDVRLLKYASFRVNIVGGSLFRLGIGAIPFLLPLMLQVGFGLSAFQSGSLTFASAAGAMLMKITAPPILRRFGFRTVIIFNAFVSGAFVMACGFFTALTPWPVIVSVLLVGGFFRSLEFTAFNALGYADIPRPRISQATSFAAVAQQVAVASGISLAALSLESARNLRGETMLVPADFTIAFVVSGLVCCLAVLIALGLRPDAGAEISGHRPKAAAVPAERTEPAE